MTRAIDGTYWRFKLLRWFGKDTPCDALTARSVDEYVNNRLKEGISRSSVSRELLTLRKSLNIARRQEFDAPDPRLILPLNFGAGYKPRKTRLTEEQVDRLIAALPPHRKPVIALIVALAATYPSELENFTRANVKPGGVVHVKGTKRTTRDRMVPVPKFAHKWLEIGLAGLPLQPWVNNRATLHDYCDKAGVPRVTPNDLRRTMASILRARGAPPNLIGLYLGHRDSTMAERIYGHVSPAEFGHLLTQAIEPGDTRVIPETKTSKKTAKKRVP